ncbi:cysteine desulfurase family protein [Thalassiella azotivora]
MASPHHPAGEASGHRAYWDAASVVPYHPRAREALLAALDDGWADPRRLHSEGRRAAALVDGARQVLAAGLGSRPDELVVTAGHADAVRTGVLGVLAGRRRVGGALVHSAVEHSSVLRTAAHHVAGGGTAHPVRVDDLGRVDLTAWTAVVHEDGVAAACLQAANGEVGTVQPVERAHAVAVEAGVPLVVDADPALGRAVVPSSWDVVASGVHGLGGPAGVGLLAVRTGVRWRWPWPPTGSDPRSGPGPVGVPELLSAAVALRAAEDEREAEDARRRDVVDLLRRRLPQLVPDLQVVGDPTDRLPHVLTFSCLYVEGEALVTELDREGFAVGSGSACTADTLEPSHVLSAMGALTHGNVRVGLPPGAPPGRLETDAERFLEVLPRAVSRLRAVLGAEGL